MVPIVTAGDDITIKATLTSGGAPIDLSAAAINAAILSPSGSVLVEATVQSPTTLGADWSQGIVMVMFPASVTEVLLKGSVYLEIQAVRNLRKTTWPLHLIQVQESAI